MWRVSRKDLSGSEALRARVEREARRFYKIAASAIDNQVFYSITAKIECCVHKYEAVVYVNKGVYRYKCLPDHSDEGRCAFFDVMTEKLDRYLYQFSGIEKRCDAERLVYTCWTGLHS